MSEIRIKAKEGHVVHVAQAMKDLGWVGPFQHLVRLATGETPLSGPVAFEFLCKELEKKKLGPLDDIIEII